MKIYSRSRWKARIPNGGMSRQGPPKEAFLHYSASPGKAITNLKAQINAIQSFQNLHIDIRGWNDLGYHFVVFQPQGKLKRARVFEGRPVSNVPAAQENHNTGTLAICVVAAPGEKLRRNTRYQISQLLKQYKSLETLGGHRDVVATACPGDEIYSWVGHIARVSGLKKFK